jgi:phenylalanyl-tRNA synthetase beta chain
MIITKRWLAEWADIDKFETDKICDTLNSIGLEVDSVQKIRIPQNIVVGKVLTCKKHPDATKLNICEVDLGNEVKQIVCGAKNVAPDQFVAVSKVGAVLPNGITIKEAKLRGVDSCGMICSSTEIGLPPLGDGIMVLDESIGELVLGKELSEFPLINDDVIELELTANRGDCLSIYGVTKDLSVPFDLEIKKLEEKEEEDNQLGIGRVLNVIAHDKVDGSFLYKVYDKEEIKSSLLIDLRLGFAGAYVEDELQRVLTYATYTTGVLLRAYAHKCFTSSGGEKATIRIKKHTNGLDAVFGTNSQLLSFVGISQNEESKANTNDEKVIVEANYTNPQIISQNSANKKIESDRHLYRSSRGSEPDLEFGMNYFFDTLKSTSNVMIYAGNQQVTQDEEEKHLSINLEEMALMIGQCIDKNIIIKILQRLGFDVSFKNEQNVMHLKIPKRRPDIVNEQDVCEEIVRIVGIDNIKSKPLIFAEKSKINSAYESFKKRQAYRYKAVGVGFYETLHFIFDDLKRVEKYGLKTVYKKREISNPITNELNTLRTSLIPNLLDSVKRNTNFGRKSIRLFETGIVFDKSRDESLKLGFVFSGDVEKEKISNHGKPASIDFFTFAQKIGAVIGDFELEKGMPSDNLSSPYEYAKVIMDGTQVGFISRVHLAIERELDLPKTYICELDMALLPHLRKEACIYSKYQISSRDLSLMVPRSLEFGTLKKHIFEVSSKELIKIIPIDIYESEEFGESMSLTLKLQFQSNDKTLEDDDINSIIETILISVKEKFGITIR